MDHENYNSSIDEIFRIVMIDKKRKVKISVQLKTSDGDEVPIRESIQKMTQWVIDKLGCEDTNQCREMIYPMMAQCMVGGMDKLMGTDATCFMLAQENVRYSLMYMMTVSFYFLKWIQEKNIKIHTLEENISQEDIEMYDRVNKAGNEAILAQGSTGQGIEVIKRLYNEGHLKKTDLKLLGVEEDILCNNNLNKKDKNEFN